ncbi:uncharacterized protein LOC143887983 [Tasmannia lanceolata]|uniref:uncharacterized protein LOC143887983 n=1 Tax=Tasmannia lanceolata TaxID=3420 RepID=UPI004063C926
MSTDPKKRSTGKFCDFHRDHDHETDHYFHLRLQLEKLAEEGHLNQYLKSPARIERSHELHHSADEPRSRHRSRSRHCSRHHRSPKRREPPRQPPTPEQPPTIVGKINIIAEGPAAGGPSTAGQRTYAERVFSLEIPFKKAWTNPPQEDQVISFSSEDFNGLQVPHDDALVIRLIIANFDIGKILVNTGSSVNVLHLETFEEMKLGEGRLGPVEYSI